MLSHEHKPTSGAESEPVNVTMLTLNAIIKNLKNDKTPELMEFTLELIQDLKAKAETSPNTLEKLQELEEKGNQRYIELLTDRLCSRIIAEREYAYKTLNNMGQLNTYPIKLVFLTNLNNDDAYIRDEAINYFLTRPDNFSVIDLILPALLKNLIIEGYIRDHAMRILVQNKKENIPQIAQTYRKTLTTIHQNPYRTDEDLVQDMAAYLIKRKETDAETLNIIIELLSDHLSFFMRDIRTRARKWLQELAADAQIIHADTKNLTHYQQEVQYEAASSLLKRGIKTSAVKNIFIQLALATHETSNTWIALSSINLLYSHEIITGDEKNADVYLPVLEKIALDMKNSVEIRNQAINQILWFYHSNYKIQQKIMKIIATARDQGPAEVTTKANTILTPLEKQDRQDEFRYKQSLRFYDVRTTLTPFFPTTDHSKCRDLIASYSLDEEKESTPRAAF